MSRIHWQLFKMGLWLGSTVFGGGGQAYPVIRQAMEERGWLTGEEVDGLYALGSFLPGPNFLNLWGAVCARIGGVWGAIVGETALMLPSFILVCALPLFSQIEFVRSRADQIMMATVWATIGLLLATGLQIARSLRDRWARWTAGLALILLFLGVHPLWMVVGALLWGVSSSSRIVRSRGA